MSAVFLDIATVGPDEVDVSPLRMAVPSLAVHNFTRPEDVRDRVKDAEYIFVNKVRVTREVIEAAERLRYIGLIATGTDNIDLVAAKERQVAVTNIRAYCTASLVEHTFGVLLYMARNIGRYTASVRAGNWQRASDFCMLDFPIRGLSAMTLGIVGHGNLGKGVARMAKAFGMQVLIARRVGKSATNGDGRVDVDELLARSDVISLHCPLTAETENLIGSRELALMKQDAMLINTARGGLVDSTALVAALKSGRIGAAAIDVLRQEPPADGDPLLEYNGENLIVTPHNAWGAIEDRQNAINEVAANVGAFISGETRNRVV
ncbi:MAG: D-2-hydroxyacid dehydrogenase [Woeseia sp.]|jgi:glycerate dehydrogenase|nr:D-2-hydroxyacid dehydrogenase [Woeseia sp.]MBT6210436.1 D-2-hydroxyacid dehydrogenase [Woeseia sp.]